MTSISSPPICCLSCSEVPRAMALPWSITTMSSASRSASSRYCGQQRGRPAAHQLVDQRPHRLAAAWVEAGGGLVQEQDRGPGDQAHGDVEPATHASGVALHHPVAGIEQVEPFEQLGCPLAGDLGAHVVQASDVLEVLVAAEGFVDGRVLAGEADAPGPAGVPRGRRSRRSRRDRRRVGAGSSGCGQRWSSRPRWAREPRGSGPARRRSRRRRAPWCSRNS